MLKKYLVVPIGLKAISPRLKEYYKDHVFTDLLFMMQLVPEGNPPFDKVAEYSRMFQKFRRELPGIPCGILVQALIGHRPQSSGKIPFQSQIIMRRNNPEEIVTLHNVSCPLDPGFQAYACDTMRRLAQLAPTAIMLDDDTRQLHPHGYGCFCPRHLKKFNEENHSSLTARELAAHLCGTSPEDRKMAEVFDRINRAAMRSYIRKLRNAIDSADPAIHGLCCIGSMDILSGVENAEIFAGRNQVPTLRIGNARYGAPGCKNFADIMHITALQKAMVPTDRPFAILGETDTYPQNRYAMAARDVIATFTGHLLEGLDGCKQWIFRSPAGSETASEKAYAKYYAQYAPFFDTLAQLVPQVRWSGPACLCPGRHISPWNPPHSFQDINTASWASFLTGRMGLPVQFRRIGTGPGMLTGKELVFFSDDEIRKQLKLGLILDGEAACILTARGFAPLMGVSAEEYKGTDFRLRQRFSDHALCGIRKGEILPTSRYQADLTPVSEKTQILVNYIAERYSGDPLPATVGKPSVTFFVNPDGGKVVVFSGRQDAPSIYLAESFKLLLANILNDMSPLAAWFQGDSDAYLKSGWLDERTILVAMLNLSYDPLETVDLAVPHKVSRVEMLQPEGTFSQCAFSTSTDGIQIERRLEIMVPAIFKITVEK